MSRFPNLDPWYRLGAGGLCFVLCLAGFATPGDAQEATASKAEKSSAASEEEDEDLDELLEPSNTGYVDDAIVASKFRLRYDSATGATKPDRAEFIYGKCLCFNALFGQDAASPGPAANLDFTEIELTYEHAFSDRFSLFVEVPFRSVDLDLGGPFAGQNLSTSGVGDIRAGMKYALVAEKDRYLTFQLRSYFATGAAEKALGTDHASIEPGFLYFSRPAERWAFSSEIRWWHPLSGSSDPVSEASGRIQGFESIRGEPGGLASPNPPDRRVSNDGYAGDVIRFGFGVAYEGRGSGIAVSPVAELVGWYVVDGYVFLPGEPIEADNDTIVNLKLGARISGKGPGSVYLGYGFPMSGDDWYDGIFRVEYRVGLASLLKPGRRATVREEAAQEDADRMPAAAAAADQAAREAAAMKAEAKAALREADARKAEAEAATARAKEAEATAMKAAAEAEAKQAAAAAEAAAAATQVARRVAAGAAPCLNLRPGPSLGEQRLVCLEPGTLVTVLEGKNDWIRLRTARGIEGWSVSRGLEAIQ